MHLFSRIAFFFRRHTHAYTLNQITKQLHWLTYVSFTLLTLLGGHGYAFSSHKHLYFFFLLLFSVYLPGGGATLSHISAGEYVSVLLSTTSVAANWCLAYFTSLLLEKCICGIHRVDRNVTRNCASYTPQVVL